MTNRRDTPTWRATSAGRTQFDSVVLSVIAITDRVLTRMRGRSWGRIIVSSSSGVVAPMPSLAISNALRLSLVGWAKTLSREVAREGITVNVVSPGRIASDRVRLLDKAKAAREGRVVASVAAESHQPLGWGDMASRTSTPMS